jgi:hypothetical protein
MTGSIIYTLVTTTPDVGKAERRKGNRSMLKTEVETAAVFLGIWKVSQKAIGELLLDYSRLFRSSVFTLMMASTSI